MRKFSLCTGAGLLLLGLALVEKIYSDYMMIASSPSRTACAPSPI